MRALTPFIVSYAPPLCQPRCRRVPQAKIMRSPDRVDANGQPRSKGYGFVEFVEHAHALAALRQVRPESGHRRVGIAGPAR